ncbi:restriction endonuclease subunit S [Kribbella alba]|uniref:Restriction endonuclease subunit S n=1 Tax=Kribbella alba TaxID=190197 RepID=A0ABN2FBA6_9ACTN
MSRIDDLIQEFSPHGVRRESLEDLGIIFGGLTGKSKADFSDGNARYVSYVNVLNNLAVKVDANDFVRVAPGEKQRKLMRGDILFTGSSETPDEVAMSSVVTADVDEPLYLNSFTIGYRLNNPNTLDPEFTKHLFRSGAMRKQLVRTASGVTRFNVSKARLAKVVVPIPPVEVQREIVRVLDSFSALEAELEAELAARRRQYVYYRYLLLTFDDDVQRKPMGTLAVSIASGKNKLRADQGEFPVYGSTGLLGYSDHFANSGDVLLVARVGANAGRVNAVGGNFDVSDNTLIVRPDEEWDVRFAFHQLTHMNLNQYAVGGGQPLLTGGLLKSLEIELPPLEVQQRIAATLDKFDALVNDLNDGLPAELNARRTQYEYYRDKLLAFAEAAA